MNSIRATKSSTEHRFSRWLMVSLVISLWAILVYRTSAQWIVFDQYTYGWAVPFLCGYLVWFEGKHRTVISSWSSSSLQRTNWQNVVAKSALMFCSLLLFPTRLVIEANPIWRAASYALALEVIVITLALLFLIGGWALLKAFAFPVSFFLVAIPWPSALENLLIQSLTRFNTAAAVELMSALGIPVLQHGNVIEITAGMVGVDEACSGVRSIQATIMITLFFGAFYRLNWRRRAWLIAAGMGVALICNLCRTSFLVGIASRDGLATMEKWHDPAGATILVTCFLGIWVIAELFRRTEVELKRKDDAATSKVESVQVDIQSKKRFLSPQISTSRALFCFLFCWILFVEGATQLWFISKERDYRPKTEWAVNWPTNQIGFHEIPIPRKSEKQLQYDEGRHYSWRDGNGFAWQVFFLAWNPAHTLKQRSIVQLAKVHTPDVCLTAIGKKLVEQSSFRMLELHHVSLPYHALAFNDNGVNLHVFFISVQEDAVTKLDIRDNSTSRLAAAWAGNRGKGQRVMEVAIWGLPDLKAAEVAFQKFMTEAIKTVER